jgi:hypothetical protein
VGLFFEGGDFGIVATSKKKGNIFSQIPCFLRGKKCQFFGSENFATFSLSF